MTNDAINGRRQRGLEIAATQFIGRNNAGDFMVPSQTENGRRYRVVQKVDGFSCGCQDFETTGQTCKHGFAVEFFLRRETKPDGTVIETRAARVTYSQPWAAYNKAQTTEKAQFCTLLRDLVSVVPSPEQKRGRPALPLADMIFAAAFKVYSTVSARRFMTDLNTATEAGLIGRTPHYNSIFNCLEKESLTPILHELITRSALPLKALETDFAVDSTGFGTQSFYRHYSAKYGQAERRAHLKLHAMVGTKTNVIAAVRVTDKFVADSPVLPVLVTECAQHFDVQQVAADKAYSGVTNLETIAAVGASAFVPFKVNALANATRNPSSVWTKPFYFFHMNRDEFLPRYHTPSNVESTFSSMKRKFGEVLRSKTPVAQQNELLLKVLCHNLVCLIHEIHESGAIGMFPALAPSCPKSLTAAQQPFEF